jgi:hypothetical protein
MSVTDQSSIYRATKCCPAIITPCDHHSHNEPMAGRDA